MTRPALMVALALIGPAFPVQAQAPAPPAVEIKPNDYADEKMGDLLNLLDRQTRTYLTRK